MDTTTIERVIVYKDFNFGFPIIDTVYSTIHLKSGTQWYVKGVFEDHFSDKQPIVIFRYNRYLFILNEKKLDTGKKIGYNQIENKFNF